MRVTRSSTRPKNQATAVVKYDDSGCDDEQAMHVPSEPSKRRKRGSTKAETDGAYSSSKAGPGKTGTTNGRRKAGKLSMLMTVPVDIFYEIACYLKPIDLLNLSRSSHALRELLMTKKSSYVWRAARESIDLPSIPSQLSEPQYANLMFGVGCQMCDNKLARKTYFAFFTRLCKTCSEANIVNGYFLLDQILEQLKAERVEEDIKLFLTLSPFQEDPQDPYASKSFKLYFKPQLASVIQDYLALKKDGQATDNFVEERLSLTREAHEKSALMETWKRRQQRSRQEEIAGLTSSRRSKILTKLRELGYQDKDFSSYNDLPEWRWKQLVNQPRDLTEKVWTNIKPELEEIIHLRRERQATLQLERNRRSRRTEIQTYYYVSRREAYDDENLEARLLRVEDLLTKPAVKVLIEDGDSSRPITMNQWREVEKVLPEMIQDHVRLVQRNCYDSLAGAYRLINKDVGLEDNTNCVFDADFKMDHRLLRSATAFFATKYYSPSIQSYADILRKRLTTESPFPCYDTSNAGCPWADLEVRADSSAVAASVFLLKEASFAQWASMQHLRSKGISFKCRRCPKEARFFMTWGQLVGHFVDKNNSESPGKRSHELLPKTKSAVGLYKGQVVDEETPKDTTKLPFSGVLEGIALPFDPQTVSLCDSGDESDSEDYYSDFFGMFDDDWDYYSGDEYPDSEDGGCIIS